MILLRVVVACCVSAGLICLAGCSVPTLKGLLGEPAPVAAEQHTVLTVPLPVAPEISTDAPTAAGTVRNTDSSCRADAKAKRRARAAVVTLTVGFESGADEVGTGVLVGQDSSGHYVLTAKHVVSRPFQKIRSITARLADNTEASAQLSPQQPRAAAPFTDIAVLLLPASALARSSVASATDWELLSPNSQRPGPAQLSIAGNPAGRGFSQTALSKSEITYDTISISQSAEGGMSGGGVFDEHNSLAGLVHSDNGRFAQGYPIAPLIELLVSSGTPVSLRSSPQTPPNVYLASVYGQPDALRKAVSQELGAVLDDRGLESGCLRIGSYKLSVAVEALYPSGSRSVARLKPDLISPNGGKLTAAVEDVSLHHLPFNPPFTDAEQLRGRLKEGLGRLADTVVSHISQAMR